MSLPLAGCLCRHSDDLEHGWCAHVDTPEGSVHAYIKMSFMIYILNALNKQIKLEKLEKCSI